MTVEKAVVQILKRCNLISLEGPGEQRIACITRDRDLEDAITVDRQPKATLKPTNGADTSASPSKVDQSIQATPERQRRSSSFTTNGAFNKIIVSGPPSEKNQLRESASTRASTLAISEGTGSLGREATWDEFPNGRFGDARSPAFGNIDGYGPTLHVSAREALILWSEPRTLEHVTELFVSYLNGTLTKLPWSEEPLSAETSVIKDQLLKLARRNWWSVASQPAVNAVRSTDEVFGWGPRAHPGFVFQKVSPRSHGAPTMIPRSWHAKICPRCRHSWSCSSRAGTGPSSNGGWRPTQRRLHISLEASRAVSSPRMRRASTRSPGACFAAKSTSTRPSGDRIPEERRVTDTCVCYRRRRIITPTIIEAASFRAWVEEAFNVWDEWRRTYPPGSPSAELLHALSTDVVLVNLIGHDYRNADRLWDILSEAEEDVNLVMR